MVFEDKYNQEIIKAIGRRIAILRTHQKVSQEKLAFKIGVCPQQIYKYEVGQNRVSVDRLITFKAVIIRL